MKIGTFSKKFNLNTSLIRFYVENGLLMPTKVGSHYEFDDKCVSDMEKILKYKKNTFTIEEIQHLLLLENSAHFKDPTISNLALNLLKKKHTQLLDARNNLSVIIKDIESEIESYPEAHIPNNTKKNIPLSITPYLYCPKCHMPLQMNSVEIFDGYIREGRLFCENCGNYSAIIANGIILCPSYMEDTPFKAFDNIETVLSISEQSSPTYRALIRKTYIWMYNKGANRLNETNFILAGPFTFNFLLMYMNKINKKSTIIICDPSLNKINKLKFYLNDYEHNIVYIAGESQDIPLKKDIIDIYLDDYSMTDYCFTYSTFPTNYIAPLLKKSCDVLGIFTDYSQAPKTINYFNQINPSFIPAKMTFNELKKRWLDNDVDTVIKDIIGSATINEAHYPENVRGENVFICGYHAKKKSV